MARANVQVLDVARFARAAKRAVVVACSQLAMRNHRVVAVIPAKAGIQADAAIPRYAVIPAKAGIQADAAIPRDAVIPAKAGIQSHGRC